jgi:hypothetical protein
MCRWMGLMGTAIANTLEEELERLFDAIAGQA